LITNSIHLIHLIHLIDTNRTNLISTVSSGYLGVYEKVIKTGTVGLYRPTNCTKYQSMKCFLYFLR